MARIPQGWQPAPDTIAQEIFLVWQEDEMPAELKQSPGYAPFTLSSEAQAWVDAMAEIQDFQDGKVRRVIGRPRPQTQRPRRQLAGRPPDDAGRAASPILAPADVAPPASPPFVPPTARPARPPEPPREPPRVVPEISPGRANAPLPEPAPTPKRPAASTQESLESRPASPPRAVPEIGGASRQELGDTGASNGQEPAETREATRAMPEIGGTPDKETEEAREKPRPMPEIG